MRIATWNVNSLNARWPRVAEWLTEMEPEVLCLQETKLGDEDFPHAEAEALGYQSVHHGQGRWNGVAILSRIGIDSPQFGFDDDQAPDPDARLIAATCGGVRVHSVYVPNGRSLDDDHYQYKLAWLARLQSGVTSRHAPTDHVVVCGDFNIAPDDRDVWDVGEFVDSTHVSGPERDALRELMAWGFHDVFRDRYPDEGLYTYWDYRGGSFHKKMGMRIDLILASTPLAERSTFALVDRNARKGKKPSDHTAVIAEFDLP